MDKETLKAIANAYNYVEEYEETQKGKKTYNQNVKKAFYKATMKIGERN